MEIKNTIAHTTQELGANKRHLSFFFLCKKSQETYTKKNCGLSLGLSIRTFCAAPQKGGPLMDTLYPIIRIPFSGANFFFPKKKSGDRRVAHYILMTPEKRKLVSYTFNSKKIKYKDVQNRYIQEKKKQPSWQSCESSQKKVYKMTLSLSCLVTRKQKKK